MHEKYIVNKYYIQERRIMTKAKLRTIIGENIRNERIARGLSIEELSEMLELTPGFVGLIERSKRSANLLTLHKLSDIFDMPIDAFFCINSVKVVDDKKTTYDIEVSRKKAVSFISRLDEKQLEFIITVAKEVIKLNSNSFENTSDE